jgi:hypothetical protein
MDGKLMPAPSAAHTSLPWGLERVGSADGKLPTNVWPSTARADGPARLDEAFSGVDLAVLAWVASLARRTHATGALRLCTTCAEGDRERSAQRFRKRVLLDKQRRGNPCSAWGEIDRLIVKRSYLHAV